MRITSYKGCRDCLMLACCSQVCGPYKIAVYKKYTLRIMVRKVSLDEAERAVFEYLSMKDTYDELSAVVYLKMNADGAPYLQASYRPERAAERIHIHLKV